MTWWDWFWDWLVGDGEASEVPTVEPTTTDQDTVVWGT